MPGDSNNQYGPFTDAILGPLSGQSQKAPASGGYGGHAATLAQFANAFINGAQQGQRTKYERSEQKKMQDDKNFDSVMAHIQSDPSISEEGKKAAQQQYLQSKYSRVQEGLKGAGKEHNDNPIVGLAKAITGAVIGPGENKTHKDIDVNSLLSIATDPRYKIDPAKSGAEGLEAVLGNTTGQKPQQGAQQPPQQGQPQQGQPAAPPAQPQTGGPTGSADNPGSVPSGVEGQVENLPYTASAQAQAAADPTHGIQNLPVTKEQQAAAAADPNHGIQPLQQPAGAQPQPAREVPTSQAEAWANPAFRQHWGDMLQKGIDPTKTQLGQWYSTLPKAGAPKPWGAPYTVTEGGKQRTKRQYIDAAGNVQTMDLGEGKQAGNLGRPVNIGEALTINDAKATGNQYEDALNPGHFIDLDSLPPTMQLKGIGTNAGLRFLAYSPTNQTIRVGGRVYEVSSREAQNLAKGAGADLGPISAGTNSTREVPVVNAAGDTVAATMLGSNKPNAPGIPGRPTAPTATPGVQPPAVAPPARVPPPMFMAPGEAEGLVKPGNIDLTKLPVVDNKDGSYSTVYSTSFQDEHPNSPNFGKEVLVRGIIDGKKTDDVNALRAKYYKDGQNLGVFETGEAADKYGQRLHEDWAKGKIKGVQMPGQAKPAATPGVKAAPTGTTPAAAPPAGGRELPGMQAGERNIQLQRLVPVRAAATQLFGDPRQPNTKSLFDYAKMADDPKASAALAKALTIAMNTVHQSQNAAGGIGEWIKNVSGAQASIEASRAQVLNDAAKELKNFPGATDAFNATLSAFSAAVGLRSISKAAGSQASVATIERDLPLIGVNTTGSRDFYDKLSHYGQEINDGTKGLGKQVFEGTEADYLRGGIQKKVAEAKLHAPDPSRKQITNKAGKTIHIGGSVTGPDGKQYLVTGISEAGDIITQD